MDTQNRFKSPVVWVSVAGLIAMILKSWFQWEIPNWDGIVTSLIAVLVGFGVLNNPTDKTGF